VLILVVALALAVVLPSLRAYLRQSEALAEDRAQVAAAEQEVADLQAEVARWDDPEYVIAEARERLAYVFPGETPYRVVDPEVVTPPTEAGSPGTTAPDQQQAPWFATLWATVEAS
jgi:cell division protein FtsB